MKSKMIIAFAFVGFAFFYHTSIFATDELYLCGIVNSVDSQNGTVSINVQSKSCYGIQTFKLPANNTRSSFKMDERQCFFINSSECRSGYLYSITRTERD